MRGSPPIHNSRCLYPWNRANDWYAFCFRLCVHLDNQPKKLVRSVLFIAAGSLSVAGLVVALNIRQNVSVRPAASFPVYTYQNPFCLPASPSPTVFSKVKAGSSFGKLFSVRWIAGLSSLGTLWLGASCYLSIGQGKRKRIHRTIEYTAKNQAKMNPLASVPAKPVKLVGKEDTVRITILPRTTIRPRCVHRQVTAPCQSRFRPTSLVSSQTRFGRLK